MPLLRAQSGVSDIRVYAPDGYDHDTPGNPVETWPRGGQRATRKWISLALQEYAPDVVLIPTARLLSLANVPTVVMVRNMEPLIPEAEEGNPINDRVRNMARRFAARRACRGATRVIAVSEFVSDVIQQRWDISAQKVGIVHHGVEVASADSPGSAPNVEPWTDGKDFIFTAGSIRPARGLDDIVDAWPILRRQIAGLRLVIAGGVDRGGVTHLRDLKRRIDAMGATDEVLWAGQLNEPEMSWCYSRAAAFVMTSRVEACPNVALEAMANGALSVSTDARPMPEFFGDTAKFYRSRSPESLAAAVIGILGRDEVSRQHLRVAARERAGTFAWERTARLTVAELSRAIAGG